MVKNVKRGRPRLGSNRMVTVGVRIEPTDRDRLKAIAEAKGLSLCAYLRDLVRHQINEDHKCDGPACASG